MLDDKNGGIEIIGVCDKEMDLLPSCDFGSALRHPVQLTLIRDIGQREQLKWMILKNANCTPVGVDLACQCLSEQLKRPVSPINAYNSFYRDGEDLWCFFSYPSDDFCVHLRGSTIIVYGKVNNLGRVMKDIMMASSFILPLHAASLCLNGKGFCLVGDSQMGKTYLASFLLEQGCRFISDDASFVSGTSLVNVDREIWVRKDMLCTDSPFEAPAEKTVLYVRPDYVSKGRSVTLHSVFTLTREPQLSFGIKNLKQPFPIIPLQSLWCSSLLDTPDLYEHLSGQIHRSIAFWDGYLAHSINIVSNGNLKDVFNFIAFHLES